MSALPEQQIPAVMHRRIGDITITTLSDGFLDGSMAVLQNITVDESSNMLRAAFRPVPRRTSVNCFLIRSAGRTALVDTGCGNKMAATGGRLMQHLAAVGVAPEEVDTILLTHMHPDHSNGLTRDDGKPFFPNAELVTHEAEPRHWLDDAQMAKADESGRLRNFQHAREQIAPYAKRHRLFRGGEVFPSVTAMPFPGHTPGHTGYMVASGGQTLLIWGDIVHVPEVQVPRPEVTMAFDVDPAQAEATRRRVFDMVATEKLLVAGMHLHFPGYAHLVKEAGGFRLLPEPFLQAL
jgi:glyoxylase-like metal-dependent hydrolase (beta-lactamase superfamily II)